MLTVSDLERALSIAGLSAPVFADEVTSSTNATALSLAEDGAPEWTLVAAGHQTGGRGRLGRLWRDVEGRALLFSLLLRPEWLSPERAGLIPLAVGWAMCGAATDATGLRVGCKWPNDLVLGGSKVGGILVESRVSGNVLRCAVAGVGVNLDPPPDVAGAGGLGDVDAVSLLGTFLRSFRSLYRPDEQAFAEAIVAEYPSRSVTIGREVEATRSDGSKLRGRAVAVHRDGSLALEAPTGLLRVDVADVQHLR